jgi:hypothetical protein
MFKVIIESKKAQKQQSLLALLNPPIESEKDK